MALFKPYARGNFVYNFKQKALILLSARLRHKSKQSNFILLPQYFAVKFNQGIDFISSIWHNRQKRTATLQRAPKKQVGFLLHNRVQKNNLRRI